MDSIGEWGGEDWAIRVHIEGRLQERSMSGFLAGRDGSSSACRASLAPGGDEREVHTRLGRETSLTW